MHKFKEALNLPTFEKILSKVAHLVYNYVLIRGNCCLFVSRVIDHSFVQLICMFSACREGRTGMPTVCVKHNWYWDRSVYSWSARMDDVNPFHCLIVHYDFCFVLVLLVLQKRTNFPTCRYALTYVHTGCLSATQLRICIDDHLRNTPCTYFDILMAF